MLNNLIDKDKEHRKLALDPTKSFIVEAPAGSGKTELLIQRLLTLLAFVKSPDEILAITFTKKAANEMRERIIKSLKDATSEIEPHSLHKKTTYLLARKVLQQDQHLKWNLIQNPNQLRIQTIDALCTYLTKQLPLLSHFGSQPNITDHSHFLYRNAVKEVLLHIEENVEWSQAIAQLLLHLDNDLNKLLHLLVSLLEKRDQWLPYIQLDIHDETIKKQLEHHLSSVINESLNKLRGCFPEDIIPELLAIARFAADHLTQSNTSPLFTCRNLFELPKTLAQNKNQWLGLASLLLTKSFSWRKRLDEDIGFPSLTSIKNPTEKALHNDYRQRLLRLIASLHEREDLRNALKELYFLPNENYDEQQWCILKSLLSVLKVVIAQLRLTFQQQGQIDFVENAQAALITLGDDDHPTDLALSLDYQICHILVDEFQDTSYTQYQLLEKLTLGWESGDGRSLFVVGDPMQSIYRFREAEVGLFIRMTQHGIGQIKLVPLTLTVNFRSLPAIVDWNNQHFQKIFPEFNDIATGAVSYSKSVSSHEDKNSIVEIKGFLNSTEEVQATYIIQLIKNLKHQNPKDKIAILVRSRSHLMAIIPALKQAKIGYRAVEIDPLASRQYIQDLLSLTCALLHPADRISWLAILRAPWCGLSLSDLLHITQSNTSISEQLVKSEVINTLSIDGQVRLKRLLAVLNQKIAERGRYHLRFWVESTWLLLGGPACLDDYADMDDVNAFFNLLEEFDLNNDVLNLEKLKENVEQLYASTQHDDTLQIMTIHTAKGLEFDTVILPHLERKNASDDKSLLLWMEQPLANNKHALLLAPMHAIGDDKNPIYEYIYRQQRIKSNYETDRLFYVATTRAIKNLYLFFNIDQNDKNHFKVESGSFLEKIWPFIATKTDQFIANLLPHSIESDNDSRDNEERYLMRLPSHWLNPIENGHTLQISSHQAQTGFKLPNHQLKIIGIVSHFIFQQISLNGIHWWQQQSSETQLEYIKQQLSRAHIVSSAHETSAYTIHKMVVNMLEDSRGKWILANHCDAKSEFSITVMLNGKIENLIIDRTFIDENGTRWIIDYKTTMFSHHDLDNFLQKEQKKYLEKMDKYHEAMKLISDHPIRMGLYFPALPAWREWE